jgi:hypothetical protein
MYSVKHQYALAYLAGNISHKEKKFYNIFMRMGLNTMTELSSMDPFQNCKEVSYFFTFVIIDIYGRESTTNRALRWQHLYQIMPPSLCKNIVVKKCNNLYLGLVPPSSG